MAANAIRTAQLFSRDALSNHESDINGVLEVLRVYHGQVTMNIANLMSAAGGGVRQSASSGGGRGRQTRSSTVGCRDRHSETPDTGRQSASSAISGRDRQSASSAAQNRERDRQSSEHHLLL